MSDIRKTLNRRQFLQSTTAAGGVVLMSPFVHTRPAKADAGQLVVVGWGGSWAQAMREHIFNGFERETGIKILEDTPPNNAKIKAMVESGNVTWDLLETDLPAILSLVQENLLEKLDYSKIDKAKLDNFPAEMKQPYSIGHKIYSFNIVYNTNVFPTGKHPKTWAEVWDAAKFPGKRTFNYKGGVSPQVEIALVADGAPIDSLYPVDEARAWASFDRLRPNVSKWYGSHSEAIQLITTGEADIGCTIGPRGIAAKNEGAPVAVEYNEGKLASDNWCIVKDTPNFEAAMSFINYAVDAKRLAEMSKAVPYGPGNLGAFEFLSAEEAAALNTSPENIENQFWNNVEWWATPRQSDGKSPREYLAEDYTSWMLKG